VANVDMRIRRMREDLYGDKLKCLHCGNFFYSVNTMKVDNDRRLQRCPYCLFFLWRRHGYVNISDKLRRCRTKAGIDRTVPVPRWIHLL